MRVLRSKRILLLAASLAVVGTAAAVAIAGVTSQTVLADGNTVHYRFVKTAANGFDSGWHHHPGLVVVQVQKGSLQFYQGSCTPKTVSVGETFIEVPYEPVRAVAAGEAVWTTSLIVRAEDPLLIPEPSTFNPCP